MVAESPAVSRVVGLLACEALEGAPFPLVLVVVRVRLVVVGVSPSSVFGSLSPFVACPSPVCLGGCVPGIVEDDAVDLCLVLGLVLEVEEEGEERGLVILPEVVLIFRGFVPRSDRLCSRVSDFGVALVGVLAEVRARLVVVEESPAVGRVVFVCLLAFVALEGVPVPPVLVVVRVRLVVVGASLVVGRAVLCLFWLCASYGFLSLLCKVCPTRMPT